MWNEPERPLSERLEEHYTCWAEHFGAITVAPVPCPLCAPDEVFGDVALTVERDWSRVPIPTVWLSVRPNTLGGYLAGLHELGHLATNRTKDGRRWLTGRNWSKRRIEAEAWRWALQKTIVPPTPACWRMIQRMLETYVSGTKSDPTFDRLLWEATKKGAADDSEAA